MQLTPGPEKASREQSKQHNHRLVFKTIYDQGEISRVDIARQTRLTPTTVSSNVAELLEEGVTGRLVPPREVDTMARALLDDFLDPVSARQRGQRARADVERRFSLDGMVAAYGDLYERLLARAAGRGALRQRITT